MVHPPDFQQSLRRTVLYSPLDGTQTVCVTNPWPNTESPVDLGSSSPCADARAQPVAVGLVYTRQPARLPLLRLPRSSFL
jgi:hypothetical protein